MARLLASVIEAGALCLFSTTKDPVAAPRIAWAHRMRFRHDRPAARPGASVQTADPRQIRTLGEQPELIANIAAITCPFDMTAIRPITAARRFHRSGTTDRISARRRRSQRGDAGSRRRCVPARHGLASRIRSPDGENSDLSPFLRSACCRRARGDD